MNHPVSRPAVQEFASSGCAWLAYAEPDRTIAGFAEARLRQVATPAQLRWTASAGQTYLLLDPQPITRRDRTASHQLLERAAAKTAAKLGAQAARRLQRLATYPDGWDQGQGRALADDSLLGLERLLDLADWSGLDVALFLSRDGQVLVNWPDAQGEVVELEIARDHFTCFMASTGDEIELPIEARAVSDVLARSR
ncbi:hypothetical protein F2Q65_14065 [Thiohalocapsa marina]|uniref:Uncharacterized protein n=1 Tax=Thiohalocapsa marina TaxID=424902 RepID=A0A5M8FLE0_9GAMM|nr:hypothetical protein [Thiohalocapsa marina]KAA6183931.1 hypothetical protein F2Q65_14065 [Thiohalocapsa marina]